MPVPVKTSPNHHLAAENATFIYHFVNYQFNAILSFKRDKTKIPLGMGRSRPHSFI